MSPVALLAACLGLCGVAAAAADTTHVRINDRDVILTSPEGATRATPLVLAFHGAMGSARQLRRALPLTDEVLAQGFRLAYLDGSGVGPLGQRGGTWNAGACCDPAAADKVADVDHVDAVLDVLTDENAATRLAMIGFSNGGMMIYRYLCEGRYRIEAAVIMAGSNMARHCRTPTRTGVLVIHGDEDRIVPAAGGAGDASLDVRFQSVDRSVETLREAGADVEVMVLDDTSHHLRDIRVKLEALVGSDAEFFLAQHLTSQR